MRMKGRGMRWSETGANNMAKVLYTKENKELFDTIERYTDGLIYDVEMEELIRGLSAAKATKKAPYANAWSKADRIKKGI